MMDLALVPISSLGIEGDIAVIGALYQETSALETAVRLSLFTDARAGEADAERIDIGIGSIDRRGWWGSAFIQDDNGSLGSRLWTLKRSTLDRETRQLARDFSLEALRWMIDLGIASAIDVSATVASAECLEITTRIQRETNPPARFVFLWEAL